MFVDYMLYIFMTSTVMLYVIHWFMTLKVTWRSFIWCHQIPSTWKPSVRHQNHCFMSNSLQEMQKKAKYAKLQHPCSRHLEFWGNPPWDLWGLFCEKSTRYQRSLCKKSALTPKVRPQRLKLVDYLLLCSQNFNKNH